jgi:DNA processing protein
MEERYYWVGFNLVKGIGAVRLRTLVDFFGSAEKAWKADANQLKEAGLGEKVIDNLHQVRSQVDLDKVWQKIQQNDITVLTSEDDLYPRRLKEIDQPPPVLYVRGEIRLEDEWSVAIVGTRRMTAYGRQVAEELADFLGRHGVTVISGLARGIDAIAHQSAIKAGGRTYAVMGSGVDFIYPPENRKLAEEIIHSGALISEYPLGTAPDSSNFPPRNRIISGLSQAVVVIEAGDTSGALITATFAAEQGKEVFAVPGYIHAPQSKGTNRLIQDGARPLLKVEDVLEALNLEQIQEYKQARLLIPADEVETNLINVLGDEMLHVDEIQVKSGLPVEKVSAALVMMELKGMVRQVGNMSYMLVHDAIGDYRTTDHV